MKNVPLGDIATLVRGVSFSKEEGSLLPLEGHLPVIRAGSIQASLLLREGQIWVPADKIKSTQKIRIDDIVMCTSSGSSDLVGKCARSTEDFDGSFGAFCAGIRADQEKASPSYLYHFLCSPVFKNWTSASSGANIKNIRVSELAEFQVPLTPARTKAHRRHSRQGRRHPPQTPASHPARRRLPPRRVSGHVRRPGDQSEGIQYKVFG